MSFVPAAPLLLYILLSLLMGWLAWALLRNQSRKINENLIDARDSLRLWLLLLAIFSLGAFMTYILELLFLVK